MSNLQARQHRAAGMILFLIGAATAIGQYIGFTMTGRVFAFLLAFPIVLVPAGLYMLATGKNPFKKLRR